MAGDEASALTEGTSVNQNDTEALAQFEEDLTRQFRDMRSLLVKKRQSYGNQNLVKFGTFGIVVRMSDKIERLVTMHRDGTSENADGDSMKDAFRDLIGYGVLALLLMEEDEEKRKAVEIDGIVARAKTKLRELKPEDAVVHSDDFTYNQATGKLDPLSMRDRVRRQQEGLNES
jgi:hypothetical protein